MSLMSSTYDLVRQPERHAKTVLDLVVLSTATLALIAFVTNIRPSDVMHKCFVALGANRVAEYFGADGPPLVTFESDDFQKSLAGVLGLLVVGMLLFVMLGGPLNLQDLQTRGVRLALTPWPALTWLTFFFCVQLSPISLPKAEVVDRVLLSAISTLGAGIALTAVLYLLGSGNRFLRPVRQLIGLIWTVVLHIFVSLLFVGQSLLFAVLWIPLQIWNAINSDRQAKE